MRGDKSQQPNSEQLGTVQVQATKKVGRFVTANIIDTEGNVQGHIISSWAMKAVVIGFVSLILIGLLVLGLVLYNKAEINEIKKTVPAVEAQ